MASQDGDKNKKKPPIVNPYARKRKPPPPSSSTATTAAASSSTASRAAAATNRTNHQSTPVDPFFPMNVQASSFSQAFQEVRETSHYKDQQQQHQQQPAAPSNPREEQQRAEQRALNLAEIPLPGTDTRDQHILLQPHVLYVSTKQRGNGVLKHIRNVPFAFSKMVPDYIMSTTSCALFLSIKYHQLYPEYIHRRLGELRTDFKLRVLLVLVDVEDNAKTLLFLNTLAVKNDLSLVLAWSELEAGRYLETFKALHGKDASCIQKREKTEFEDQMIDFLTACKPINKTDAKNLVHHFSKVREVMAADRDQLALCEGLGPIKVRKLWDAFHKPFSKVASRKRKKEQEEKEKKMKQEQEQKEKEQKDVGEEEEQQQEKDSATNETKIQTSK